MKTRESELLFLYLLVDLILLNLSLLGIAIIQYHIPFTDYNSFSDYILYFNTSWIITYFLYSKKNLHLRDGFRNRFTRLTKRHLLFVLITTILIFILQPENFSRQIFFEHSLIFYGSKLIFYYFVYKYLKFIRAKGFHSGGVIVVGANKNGQIIRKLIDNNPDLGYNFLGFVDDSSDAYNDVIGNLAQLGELIQEKNPDTLFIALSLNDHNKIIKLIKTCDRYGVRVKYIPEEYKSMRRRINAESVGDIMLINPREIPLDDFRMRWLKRIFDIVFSVAVFLFIFSWLLPILAILIKLSSKGPVFFTQPRTGLNNNTFNCYKFRSMRPDKRANEVQATADDDRITSIGKFMRKTSIDELPQFFNVLMGDMSVVGPRPHMLKHTEHYSAIIENYLIRHFVKPGITGWAQVHGFRGETDEIWKMEKRVEYDNEYLEIWSFFLDLKIIYLTVFGKKTRMNAF